MTSERNSFRHLVFALVDDASTLFRQEMDLARAEGGEKLSEVSGALINVVAGLLIAVVALLVLVQALVVALAEVMPDALAALAVGAALAIIAFVLVYRARALLSLDNLSMPRTRASLRQDKETVMEAVR
jgi:hypothetical protein